MNLSALQKTIAAAIALMAIGASGVTYMTKYALANDLETLKKEIKDQRVIEQVEKLNDQIEFAKHKKEVGIEGQDEIIDLLEKQKEKILLENGVKKAE